MPDSPTQIPLYLTAHNNQSLFSDHYLDDILFRSPAWQTAVSHARPFLTWLRALYEQEKEQLASYKESQLEENWFKPIFARLGHVWEVQAAIPGLSGSVKKPDYAFFPDEAARQTAVSQQNTPLYAQYALAVGEVKQWEINLSKKTGSQPTFADQNPMYQIDAYLTLTGLDWGILSNGRFWRLLHKSSARTLETYFEIDLLAALLAPNDNAATAVAAYFWLFFHQSAFRPDAHGRIFLDEALKDSRAYAIALEADLRDNAYRSLEQLIIGFFSGDATLDKSNPAHRAQVYQNSLYLLYRLLFLFYGESRALLPMHNAAYKAQYSLQQLAQTINVQRNQLTNLPATGKRYWNRLTELFRLISGGDPLLNADLNVPRYNGGLFDPQQHPFLEQHFVGDRFLARAIDYLAFRRIVKDGGLPQFQAVDYRTLDVRQLGSIYEGMLEYKVAVATEEMVTINKSGVETWVPIAQKGKAKTLPERRQPGDLYLTNDKGERKATGSYYTPDYIVEYIVANTLGPLVAAARERVKAQARDAGPRDKAARQKQSADLFIAEILRLNVLDPAMGSGHFLVEATHFLARALATDEYVQAAPPQIGSFLENEPISGTTAETDLLYWKRRVVEACIYGVDKNPMAVELAKLSLWLKTAASDKPLSFLDHHLQHGDSLIGAWLDDLNKSPVFSKKPGFSSDQQPLFDDSAFTRDAGLAVKGVATIESLPTLDIDDVHAKEAAWRDIQQTHVARWRRLADLWVSAYFGNTMAPEEYRALADRLQGRASLLSDEAAAAFLAHPAVTGSDYFHWELAFPEVFFDEYGRHLGRAAGFDAVIGNPPYVRQEQLTPLKPFFSQHFAEVYAGTADLFVYFFKQAINLLRQEGVTSYISSNSWLRANYATNLRAYLHQNTTIETLIDLGDNRVFADAPDLYPAIHIVRCCVPPKSHLAKAAVFSRDEDNKSLETQLQDKLLNISIHDQPNDGWRLETQEKRNLAQKILSFGTPLSEVVESRIYRGILTGLNDAFLISTKIKEALVKEDKANEALIKPIVNGADIRPWHVRDEGTWLIAIPNGWTRETANQKFQNETSAFEWFENNYSALANYLVPFADRGRKRADQGEFWWELRPCNYWQDFEEDKIFYPEMSKYPRFSLGEPGIIGNKTSFMIPIKDSYLLGVLMSRISWFVIQNICQPIGERAGMLRYTLSTQFMGNLPIADATDAAREQIGANSATIDKELSMFAS